MRGGAVVRIDGLAVAREKVVSTDLAAWGVASVSELRGVR